MMLKLAQLDDDKADPMSLDLKLWLPVKAKQQHLHGDEIGSPAEQKLKFEEK